MAWYRDGTVNVQNGDNTVIGVGTAFVANVNVGDLFTLQAGQYNYEVVAVISDTELTLDRNYEQSNQSNQNYSITPTRGFGREATTAFNGLRAEVESYINSVLSGFFENGTEAQPGISFIEDPDTGVRRASSNELALVTGGVDQLSVAGGVATGAAVQSSQYDDTPGRLMLVGAFGLAGAMGNIGNAAVTDNSIKTGFYEYSGSAGDSGGPPGRPLGSLIHLQRSSSGGEQQLFIAEGSTVGGELWTRSRTTGAWSDWARHYSTDTALGTVTQSGGIPTGALIERGSNANGDYVRFADGTQICRHSVSGALAPSLASGNIFRSGEYSWTYAAAFSSTEVVVHCSPRSSATIWSSGRVTTTTTGAVELMSSVSGGSITIDLLAVGSWF
jgi:hypothetical protein